jgi:RNA polymerase sigma-70 factor (ECF subfamily)
MRGAGPVTERELARGLRAGDVDAMAAAYDQYGTLAYSVAVRVLGDRQKAEDVTQEAFLKLWTHAGTFDESKGSLRTWLLTMVRNRAIDALRGRGAHERSELPLLEFQPPSEATGDPWRAVAAGLEAQAVREAMASLPIEQRQVVELAYYGGYTQREIAELSRVPIGTVKGRTRLALEKLHSYLSGRGLIDAG